MTDTCAIYLLAKKEYLHYERALGQGWPHRDWGDRRGRSTFGEGPAWI